MHIKTLKIRNPKNILVQVPGFVANNWSIQEGDSMEVHISDDEKYLIIKPRKGYAKVSAGSNPNQKS